MSPGGAGNGAGNGADVPAGGAAAPRRPPGPTLAPVFGAHRPGPDDILRLVAARAPESLTLEYKSQISERASLLDTVCALLNTDGGDVLFGVAEDRGMPVAVPGVAFPDNDPDRELLRLDALVRTGLEPTPDGFGFATVRLPDGAVVVWFRCAASPSAPHRVRDTQKFMRRNSAGKHPMGVDELRQAFGRQKTRLERTLAFRAERLGRLQGWSPVALVDGARLVLHAVPRAAFSDAPPDLVFGDPLAARLPWPVVEGVEGSTAELARAVESRHNLDGVLRVPRQRLPGGEAGAYVQVFANGAVEWVAALRPAPGRTPALPVTAVIYQVMASFGMAIGFWECHGLDAPWTLLLALDGVGGWRLDDGERGEPRGLPADRAVMVFSELVVTGNDEAAWAGVGTILTQRLYQAFGLVRGAVGERERDGW